MQAWSKQTNSMYNKHNEKKSYSVFCKYLWSVWTFKKFQMNRKCKEYYFYFGPNWTTLHSQLISARKKISLFWIVMKMLDDTFDYFSWCEKLDIPTKKIIITNSQFPDFNSETKLSNAYDNNLIRSNRFYWLNTKKAKSSSLSCSWIFNNGDKIDKIHSKYRETNLYKQIFKFNLLLSVSQVQRDYWRLK